MRLGLKIAMVFLLTLALLLPLAMIRGLINERQAYRQQAVAEVTRSHAGAQGLVGPVLVVPYRELETVEERDAQGVARRVQREVAGQWLFFPKTLALDAKVLPGIRKRGLHPVRVYEWQGRLDATFDARLPPADPQRGRTLGQPWIDIGIGDVRGLVGVPALRAGGRALQLQQGQRGRAAGGLHALLPAGTGADGRIVLPLRLDFALRGTEALAIAPLGDANRIGLASPWPHPQFNGDFLPRRHRVDGSGFSAQWDVSSLASNAQQQYRRGGDAAAVAAQPVRGAPGAGQAEGQRVLPGIDAIGLSLVEPVNRYSKVDRATKYGLLFVLLTFTAFFLFETLRGWPIHPIQYGLVGLALAVFFLLLLSLSEHIAFGRAYLAAALACLGLIGFYLAHVLGSPRRGAGFAAALGLLYAALYGLLVSEDNALALGAGLLFAILAAVMVATRRVDWYQVGSRAAPPPPRREA